MKMTMTNITSQEYFRATPEQQLSQLTPLDALPPAEPHRIRPECLAQLPLPPELQQDRPHLLVGDARMRRMGSACVYHVYSGPLPKGSLLRIDDMVATASPAFALVQRAARLSVQELILAGDELCGTYALAPTEEGSLLMRERPIATISQLEEYVAGADGIPGVKKTRRALRYMVEGSASPRESIVEMLLCLPPLLGGFGLPKPVMNFQVVYDEAARKLTGHSFARCDLAWPAARLIIEVDSDAFHGGVEQLHHDQTRMNALKHMGYAVISVTNNQLRNLEAFTCLVQDIAALLGKRLRTPSPERLRARRELHSLLLFSPAGQHS